MLIQILTMVIVIVIGVAVIFAHTILRYPKKLESIERASLDFSDYVMEISNKVCEHPEIDESGVKIRPVKDIPTEVVGTNKSPYGVHSGSSLWDHNYILISEQKHTLRSNIKDTVIHEYAHYLDCTRRGYSNHDDTFHDTKEEIERFIN